MKAGTYLLSTAYTPTRIMGILAGDEEQAGVSSDDGTNAAADTGSDASSDGAADTAAGGGESGQ